MENKLNPNEALSFGRDFLSAGKKSPFVGSSPTPATTQKILQTGLILASPYSVFKSFQKNAKLGWQ